MSDPYAGDLSLNPKAKPNREPDAAHADVPEELDDMTIPELRDLADELGVDVPSKASKAEIVAVLDAAQAELEEPST